MVYHTATSRANRRDSVSLQSQRGFRFETASDPGGLNIDEFLTFRHPEHSHVTLLNMVTQIISDLDTDGDGVLSEDEFASVESSEKDFEEKNRHKRLEFRHAIDTNHDGKVRHPCHKFSNLASRRNASFEINVEPIEIQKDNHSIGCCLIL